MALSEYQKKRRFNETPEPRGTHEKGGRNAPLHFVVQEHHARSLHWDFRLELDGVLKSWAVPKGPSMRVADKRLAVQTEDHPLDYGSFEGEIPKGHYGAGKVSIWDSGVYGSKEAKGFEGARKKIKAGLRRGEIKFVLFGEKLKGGFVLVKLKGQENNWLLIKEKDEYAGTNDMRHVQPMLAKLADQPFDKEGWLFEVKWDGYRAIAEILPAQAGEDCKVKLYSRNGKSFNDIYTPIVKALAKIKHECVLDGEIVAVLPAQAGKNGRSDFHTLQQYMDYPVPLQYVVFDLLYLNGKDLRKLPLIERKKRLKNILPKKGPVVFSEHVEKQGIKFFNQAKAKGLEGIIGKDASSPYREGTRSGEWQKFKSIQEQEAIIVGYTAPRGSRKKFGSLVLAAYEGKKLRYIGQSGGGFTEKELHDLYDMFQKAKTTKSPLEHDIGLKDVTWVKPRYVCQIKFTEWTPEGLMRHPIYAGLRSDKEPREVVKEIISGKTVVPERNGLKLSNLDKLFFPKEKITKGDIISYYNDIADVILPYLKDRPENLNRHPNGINGESFYHKNYTQKLPSFVKQHKIYSEHNGKYLNYIVCNNKETLLYLANLGCIEINPWNSRIGDLDKPDYMIFDLDPHGRPYRDLIAVALEVRKVLRIATIESFIKTSGKTGLHIMVPLGARYRYEIVRHFAELIMRIVHKKLPKITSLERNPQKRKGLIYLDFLQNARGQTLACAYSVRPHKGATVSTPLEWKEVKKGLDPSKFTIHTIGQRLAKKGDLWAPLLGKAANLTSAISHLQKII